MIGTPGNDRLVGTSGADTIYGEDGNDLILGKGGADVLVGQDGNDTLSGGAGDDYLVAGSGHDVLKGGAGIDWADFQDATGGVSVDLSLHGAQQVATGVVDTFSSIERLYGSAGDDHLVGGHGDNLFNGADGNDTLEGGRGSDTLIGGDGDDRLDGGRGADVLQGGAGNDAYVVDNARDVVTEAAGAGTDTIYANVSYGLTANVEQLELTGHKDLSAWSGGQYGLIIGNRGDNHIAFSGGDTVYGGQGHDTLSLVSLSGGDGTVYEKSGDVFDFSQLDADPNTAGVQAFQAVGDGHQYSFTADGQYAEVYGGPIPDGGAQIFYIFHISDHTPDVTVTVEEGYHGPGPGLVV